MLDATLRPRERMGMSFVWKSNKPRLRLIIDARRSNCWFRPSLGVRLCTSEAFANIEVGDGDFESLESFRLYLGMADAKDCFRRLRAPVWLRPFFAWPEVPARVLGLAEL